MALEGIVVQVIPQKERDLIARMLLRDGTLLSCYVYGGMGGGAKSKPRVYEPGNLMSIELRTDKSGHLPDSLPIVSESLLKWQPQNIRHDARGFALACLYMEMMLKTGVKTSLDNESTEHDGLFNVLSNGLFYLDESIGKKQFSVETHLLLFLSKFLLQLGILPDEGHCILCGNDLSDVRGAPLVLEQGGFACLSCGESAGDAVEVRLPLQTAVRTKFQNWSELPMLPMSVHLKLMQFWCYHMHVKLPELNSYRLIF